MRVLFASPEVVPFSKTGGLADVAGALPAALAELGHEVAVFTPLYRETREGKGPRPSPTGVSVRVTMGEETVSGSLLRSRLPGGKVTAYLIDAPELYDREGLYGTPEGPHPDNCARFVFFCRACLEAVRALKLSPQVLHCHDWQTALIPVYRDTLYRDDPVVGAARTVLTIHNLAYQGVFWHLDMPLTGLDWSLFNWRELEYYGKINFLKGGIVHADAVTVVSPSYAREIRTPEHGAGLEGVLAGAGGKLVGILNGADYSAWNPETDRLIPARYSLKDMKGKAACKRALQRAFGLPQRARVPLIGMVGRLDPQKGLDLIEAALPALAKEDLQMVFLGAGEERYREMLERAAAAHPKKIGARVAFDEPLAHLVEAGSDMFLMPSRYEPCGLNQMYSLKYGTVPIVRATGGLADTVVDAGAPESGKKGGFKPLAAGRANGFAFKPYKAGALAAAVRRALALYADRKRWAKLVGIGMRQDFSWARSAGEYAKLYEKLAT